MGRYNYLRPLQHTTTFNAVNPQADGCASGYTDYFTYSGRARAKKVGQVATYEAFGTEHGRVFAPAPCIIPGIGRQQTVIKKTELSLEINLQKHAAASLIKVSKPNPINSQANISYSVAQAGRVNITVYNSCSRL